MTSLGEAAGFGYVPKNSIDSFVRSTFRNEISAACQNYLNEPATIQIAPTNSKRKYNLIQFNLNTNYFKWIDEKWLHCICFQDATEIKFQSWFNK